MFTPVRTCLLWGLGITSILAGWQGVNASTVFPDRETPVKAASLPVEANSPALPPPRPGLAEDAPVRSSVPAAPSPSSVPSEPELDTTVRDQAWPLGTIRLVGESPAAEPGPPVLVAVLDTGIDGDHRDLSGKVVAEMSFVDGTSTGDVYGHGTPIAGIIAADADDTSGIAGMAPASRLINVKVADDKGTCQGAVLSEGIIWAVDNGARVINISIEMESASTDLEEAVEYAWDHGAVIITAAGNDGDSRPVYPAAYEHCLSVTAIRESGELAPLANYGDWVDLAAPGFDIYTTLPDDSFGYKHGTSFAAAYVSGLAALLYPLVTDANQNGYVNDEVVWAILAGASATDIDGTGEGLIDVAGSLEKAVEIGGR